jgi:hypothetical protein
MRYASSDWATLFADDDVGINKSDCADLVNESGGRCQAQESSGSEFG